MAIGNLFTLCWGVNDKCIYSVVFENYLKLFKRDVTWSVRKGQYKMWLCGVHGPQRGTCCYMQIG
jgi:hypothetical protein